MLCSCSQIWWAYTDSVDSTEKSQTHTMLHETGTWIPVSIIKMAMVISSCSLGWPAVDHTCIWGARIQNDIVHNWVSGVICHQLRYATLHVKTAIMQSCYNLQLILWGGGKIWDIWADLWVILVLEFPNFCYHKNWDCSDTNSTYTVKWPPSQTCIVWCKNRGRVSITSRVMYGQYSVEVCQFLFPWQQGLVWQKITVKLVCLKDLSL